MGERGRDDVFEAPRVEIGGDLDQERPARLGLVTRGDHARDQLVERVAARCRRSRKPGVFKRRDVDGQIVGERREGPDAEHIVLDPVGRILVGADVDPHLPPARRSAIDAQAAPIPLEAVVVEAEAAMTAARVPQAKEARGRALRRPAAAASACRKPRRSRAEPEHGVRNFGALVETGGKPKRVREPQAEDLDGEGVGSAAPPSTAGRSWSAVDPPPGAPSRPAGGPGPLDRRRQRAPRRAPGSRKRAGPSAPEPGADATRRQHAHRQGGVEVGEESAPPRESSQRKSAPSASASTAAKVRSSRLANHLCRYVSAACPAVEEMDEAVLAQSDRRHAGEDAPGRRRLAPFHPRANDRCT